MRIALLAVLVATAAHAETPYEKYVTASLKAWGAPGAAVAIVKDGKVTLLRGFGVRELGKPEKVDERTLFPLASLTKAFTAATVGALVEEGKLAWDEPVVTYLPTFRVADPDVTRLLTLRDLAAHRTGLAPSAELLWYRTTLDQEEIFARLHFLQQAESPRQGEAYQNVMYLVLGKVVAAASAKPFDDVVRERLLGPAGMTDAVLGPPTGPNVATPHLPTGPISLEPATSIAPAAGLTASARDLTRWLRLFLEGGAVDGKKVLAPETIAELLRPQNLIQFGPQTRRLFPSTHFMAWGLGWVAQDYAGRQVLWNTGGLDGATCSIALVPEAKLGVVVLTNFARTGLPEALVWRAVDDALGNPAKDWSELKLKLSLAARAREEARLKEPEKSRHPNTKPALPVADYAGTYHQDLLGELELVAKDDRLQARLNGWVGTAEHWHHDTFRITWSDEQLGKSLLSFALDAKGVPARVELEDAGSFTRRP